MASISGSTANKAVNPKLKLSVKRNEALRKTFRLNTRNTQGVKVPLDLDGREFKAQCRAGLSLTSNLLFDIVISKADDGVIEFYVDNDDIKDVTPGTYYYDLLMMTDGADPQNIWTAHCVVEEGVTEWST